MSYLAFEHAPSRSVCGYPVSRQRLSLKFRVHRRYPSASRTHEHESPFRGALEVTARHELTNGAPKRSRSKKNQTHRDTTLDARCRLLISYLFPPAQPGTHKIGLVRWPMGLGPSRIGSEAFGFVIRSRAVAVGAVKALRGRPAGLAGSRQMQDLMARVSGPSIVRWVAERAGKEKRAREVAMEHFARIGAAGRSGRRPLSLIVMARVVGPHEAAVGFVDSRV